MPTTTSPGNPEPLPNLPPQIWSGRFWTEPGNVDTVAEESCLVLGGDARAGEQFEVLAALNQLDVGEASGDCLEAVHEQSLRGAVVLRRIQPVNGVGDHRNSGEPTEHPPVEPGLRIVGMENIEPFTSQNDPEVKSGPEIGQRMHPPR